MSHLYKNGSYSNNNNFLRSAFEEESDDEAIKVYGTTKSSSPKSAAAPANNNRISNGSRSSSKLDGSDVLQQTNDSSNRNLKYPDDTTSRDSDSLIQDYSGNSLPPIYYSTTTATNQSQNTCCFFHPKVKENWRTVLAAVTLLFVGVLLVFMGIYALSEPNNGSQAAVFFIAGFICFIPGSYHVVYIYLAARGFRGFDFYHLPLFT